MAEGAGAANKFQLGWTATLRWANVRPREEEHGWANAMMVATWPP